MRIESMTSSTEERGAAIAGAENVTLVSTVRRRRVGHLFALIVAATISTLAAPARSDDGPIRIVFPFAAGGSGDALARIVGERLQSELSRKVIVENRIGSAGLLGVAAVKNAAPDGATILMSPIAPM